MCSKLNYSCHDSICFIVKVFLYNSYPLYNSKTVEMGYMFQCVKYFVFADIEVPVQPLFRRSTLVINYMIRIRNPQCEDSILEEKRNSANDIVLD